MPDYLVIYKAEEGCDYSIGCGVRTELVVDVEDEAALEREIAARLFADGLDGYLGDGPRMQQVHYIDAANLRTFDVAAEREVQMQAKAAAQKAADEAAERRMLDTLQRKYGRRHKR